MRIVYAGTHSGTCLSRFNALKSLVPETIFFDIDPYYESSSRLYAFFERMFFYGPQRIRLNLDFLTFCRKNKPQIIWIDKSIWVWPQILKLLSKDGCYLVHYNTDALHPRKKMLSWSLMLMRQALPLYDLNVTSNEEDYQHALNQGLAAHLTQLAYDDGRFNNAPLTEAEQKHWATPIIFIGHYEPRTERFLSAVLDENLPLKIYGHNWLNSSSAQKYPDAFPKISLSDADYVKALKGASIAICCVSEWNYNQTAGRSYEIPATGTFLLAYRTQGHERSYIEGKEAEFFSTSAELVQKLRFYLAHQDERRAIANSGWLRCTSDKYTWARYTQDIWRIAEHNYDTLSNDSSRAKPF
jgi:spore maturation protein CgeB